MMKSPSIRHAGAAVLQTFVRASLMLAFVMMSALSPSIASADPTSDDRAHAEKVKAEGDSSMQQLRYVEALEAYNRAFALYPDPRLLYNRGNACMALGRYPEALEQFEAFRDAAPQELKAKVPGLNDLIENVRTRVSTLEIVTRTRGARVVLGEQIIGTTPLAHPIKVNAGTVALELDAEGYEAYQQQVLLPGGGTLRLEPNLVPRPGTTLLAVRSQILGARVAVDQREIGSAPAELMVSPGAHRVRVTHPDYETTSLSTVVAAGEHKTLDVQLEGKKPLVAKWWFWTGVGVVVAGTVGAILIHNAERPADHGDIAPGRAPAPLMSF
jgi:hypothetical protein